MDEESVKRKYAQDGDKAFVRKDTGIERAIYLAPSLSAIFLKTEYTQANLFGTFIITTKRRRRRKAAGILKTHLKKL
jgi:hypothetical protein